MKHPAVRLAVCAIVLFLAACAPQATSSPTPAMSTLAGEIDTWLTTLTEDNGFSGAVLIARNGQVLLSKGYGLADREKDIPNTPQTKFRIYSITKQFTAMAILMLQAQGKLDVNDPICKYVTDCPAAWKDITLHHLLTHTSGIPEYPLDNWTVPHTSVQLIAVIRDLPISFQPGEDWSYSSSNYVLLGYVIEQVSGLPYGEFLQQNILVPLDLRDTGYDYNTAELAVGYLTGGSAVEAKLLVDASNQYAAGAMYSTVEDLYRWDQALYTEQLIPQRLLDQMFTPHWAWPESDLEPGVETGYGYGWLVGVEHGHRFTQHGGFSFGYIGMIWRYPDDQVTIIVLSNQENVDIGMIMEELSKRMLGDE